MVDRTFELALTAVQRRVDFMRGTERPFPVEVLRGGKLLREAR